MQPSVPCRRSASGGRGRPAPGCLRCSPRSVTVSPLAGGRSARERRAAPGPSLPSPLSLGRPPRPSRKPDSSPCGKGRPGAEGLRPRPSASQGADRGAEAGHPAAGLGEMRAPGWGVRCGRRSLTLSPAAGGKDDLVLSQDAGRASSESAVRTALPA